MLLNLSVLSFLTFGAYWIIWKFLAISFITAWPDSQISRALAGLSQ